MLPDDGARRRHLRLRARGRHRRRRGLVRGAAGRTDRQLRRVGGTHPGADEGAGRSGPGPAAGRHRRQRHRHRRADGGDGGASCATAWRRAPWPSGSAAPTRRARRWPRSSGCSGSRRPAARRRTSTCAATSTGLRETIAAAKAAGAALHIVHVNSSAGDEIDQFLAAIQAARDAGQDVTTEAYPVRRRHDRDPVGALRRLAHAGPTSASGCISWSSSGERLTRATFAHGSRAGRHGDHPRPLRGADPRRHRQPALDDRQRRLHRAAAAATRAPRAPTPRCSARTCATSGALTLMDALRRMTLEPARRLERRVPAMAAKGRVKVGADADLTIFDPRTGHRPRHLRGRDDSLGRHSVRDRRRPGGRRRRRGHRAPARPCDSRRRSRKSDPRAARVR